MDLPEPGANVGRFEILDRLGGGGMGVVYKARDRRLGRLVALKFMATFREDSEEAHVRFLREARAVAALDHPNVCTLYEIGEQEDGRIFLVMALCEGETLRERLRRGPLPPRDAVQIALQVADGLAAAHARGIIHRDIKPTNLLLSGGLVKIIDFGVAHLDDHSSITREGMPIGTFTYTAPEHFAGGEPGPGSDIWSLGVVLYESLAGRLPFQAKTLRELLLAISTKAPAPLEGVNPALRRVVERAMARAPRNRYASAEEMQADLLAVMSGATDQAWELQSTTPSTNAPISQMGPPLLHNLPFPPIGSLLKGRAQDLQALEESLSETLLQSHVLHGLGGIGKTRLAVEHAWNQGRRFQAALFVRADSPEGLNSSLASLARPELLNLPERDSPSENEVTAAVLRWLRDNSGWLLILDNVDTREAILAVTRLLPMLTAGRVLITSRRRDWPPTVHRQSLELIPRPAAADFLLKRTAKERWQESDDEMQALHLAELLDGLPLALEQAAAYICHTQISIAEYLEIWAKECDSILSWYDEAVMNYSASLAVTWQRTFRELSPVSKAILRILAHFTSDPIPVQMIEDSPDILHKAAAQWFESLPVASQGSVRNYFGELMAVSLITRQGSLLSLHPVVQEVIRQSIPPGERAAWIELSNDIANSYIPGNSDDSISWQRWDLLRPHVTKLVAYIDEEGLSRNPSGLRLRSELGQYLYGKGLYSEAEPFLAQTYELNLQVYDRQDPAVAVSLLNHSMLLKATGRFDEAEDRMRTALDIFRAERHSFLPRPLNGLALLLMERGEWIEAEALIREALEIDVTRGDRSGEGRDLHNLALLFMATHRSGEAEGMIRKSLEIGREISGDSHPRPARRMQILAGILKDLGREDEAAVLLEESLGIFERILGPHHPQTQSARRDLEALKQNGEASEEASPLDR